MRNQTIKLKTGQTKNIIMCLAASILIFLIIVIFYNNYINKEGFAPPEYEINAQSGVPSVEERYSFGSISAPIGFSVGLCGTMYQQQDGSLVIYLTNPESNDVNIRCEIKDEKENILYQSGVLKPNEYVERLEPIGKIKNQATKIYISIYAYEQDTWYSQGTIELENILQPY